MDAYSTTLLSAMILAGLAAAAALTPRPFRTATVRAGGIGLGIAGFVMLGVSFAMHMVRDHGPGSPEPMALPEFLRVHPAYVIVLIVTVAAAGVGLARSSPSDPRENPTSEEPVA